MSFDDAMLVEMLRRSYFACDGLWFVKIEDRRGLEEALQLDDQVWAVMPKIQARKARELLGIEGSSLADLQQCIALKFVAEGHEISVRRDGDRELEVAITRCPWREALERSGRTGLGPEIARRICEPEAAGWAAEFGEDIALEMAESICEGGSACRLLFRRREP